MISEFKFFQKNKYKERCRLQIGSSFTYRGDYCTVINMLYYGFGYRNQSHPTVESYMTYQYYLTTPSAAGRQLNRIW
jgi:hypothetical protein